MSKITTSDVIAKLGGTEAVRELFGNSAQAVSKWRSRGVFPAHTYVKFAAALRARGMEPDLSLWRFERQSGREAAE